MTKAERLAVQIQRDKEALAQRQASLREVTRKATNKRRYQVGAMADDAGLLGQEDATLRQAFVLIARLIRSGHLVWAAQQHEPDPETERKVQALIANDVMLVVERDPGTGVAETRSRVSATH
jgi:hypothetical protein